MDSAPKTHLEWSAVAQRFHVLSAKHLLAMDSMQRHQSIQDEVAWLRRSPPLALLFISHRWESLEHPDLSGKQLAAIQKMLRLILAAVEAMLVEREQRLAILPLLQVEGSLQAAEIARRMLGFGPFSDSMERLSGNRARSLIEERWAADSGDKFRAWLAANIGVWLDYSCMPQKPHSGDEALAFRQALASLGDLVMSSTVLSLRYQGDDYPHRAWCASEFFLGSSRSFARGVFVDIEGLEADRPIDIVAPPPAGSPEANVLVDAYSQDREDFEYACAQWTKFDHPFIDVGPPNAWSPYRWMWGNGVTSLDQDPNPFRLVLNGIMELETDLIRRWLMSSEPCRLDLAETSGKWLQRQGLRCADDDDLNYLGVLTASNGWVEPIRTVFSQALARYPSGSGRAGRWACTVDLPPLHEQQRALFEQVEPNSPGTWHSRLSTGPGPSSEERDIVGQLLSSFEESPPQFSFVENDA